MIICKTGADECICYWDDMWAEYYSQVMPAASSAASSNVNHNVNPIVSKVRKIILNAVKEVSCQTKNIPKK
uniref:Uncharacterized protein n=1 Tax=viral metagenome TaxID=1070528 RepID=A0A6M3J0W6_9ZZZZ